MVPFYPHVYLMMALALTTTANPVVLWAATLPLSALYILIPWLLIFSPRPAGRE